MLQLAIVSGSAFGTAEEVARHAEQFLQDAGIEARHLPRVALEELLALDPQALLVVTSTTGMGEVPDNLQALQPLESLPGSEQLPASPAVAIWDQQGRLAYFGPYSEGALCTSSNSFIEPIIEALLAGRSVRADSNLAVGCFCDWRD